VVGAVANVPFNGDRVPGSSDPEIDLYGAYSIALPGGVTLTPGFTSYHYPNAPTRAGFYRTTFEPNVAASFTLKGVRLTPKLYYDVVLKGPTGELTATYALPLQDVGTELDFTATYGGYRWQDSANHASPDVKSWGQYWLAGVSLPYQLSRQARVALGFAYTEGWQAFTKAGSLRKEINGLAAGRGVVTLAFTWGF